MTRAILLALKLRTNQYKELLLSCLLRPNAAAQEIVERPGMWSPGAWLILLASVFSASLFDLPRLEPFWLRNSLLILFFVCGASLLCRPRAGAFRPRLWLELAGYCWLPSLLATTFVSILFPAIYHMSDWLHLSGQVFQWMLIGTGWILYTLAVFAMLRMAVASVRAVTRGSHAYAVLIVVAALAAAGWVMNGRIGILRWS